MKTRYTYLLGLMLIVLSIQLLISCSPWDLPERKSQRNCQKPGGTINAPIQQRDVTFSISNPTGTIDNVSWDFGNGSTTVTTGTTPVRYTYPANGTYTVIANLNNTCENGTTIQQIVTVTNAVLPTVTLQPITDARISTATAQMTITSNGNATITRYGLCYSATNQTPVIEKDQTQDGTATAVVNTAIPISVTGLQSNTTYYVRSFAVNIAGTSYSSPVQQFRTGSSPSVNTGVATSVDVTMASVIFVLNNPGNPTAVEYGIVYGTSTPDVNNSRASIVVGPNVGANTTVNLTNLLPNTTYYYRSYAKLPNGDVIYGTVQSFTTQVDAVAQDLVAHLTFSDRSLVDISGNNNNALLVGNPTFTNDRKNNANSAIQLDGIDDYFYMADNASLRPLDALSVSIWIRPNAINNVNDRIQLFNKSRWNDSGGEMYSSLIKKNENGPGLTFMTNVKQNSSCQPAKGWQNLEFSSNPQLGDWYHVVLVYSGRTMRMYFNGTPMDQRMDLPATRIDDCPGGELKFGAQLRDFPNYFSGAMDDIRIYRRALSASEVQTLFNAAN